MSTQPEHLPEIYVPLRDREVGPGPGGRNAAGGKVGWMHGSQRQRLVATAAVAIAAVAAVTVALVVVSLTRPSDQEIQEKVAVHLGVPEEVLDVPIVRRVLEQTSAEARSIVFDELDQSLLLGGIAGLVAAVGASILIMRPWRVSASEPPGDSSPDLR